MLVLLGEVLYVLVVTCPLCKIGKPTSLLQGEWSKVFHVFTFCGIKRVCLILGFPQASKVWFQYWYRTGLICLLVGAMDGTFIIEQPGSSLFFHYMYVRAAFQKLILAGLKVWGCNSPTMSFWVAFPPKSTHWIKIFGGVVIRIKYLFRICYTKSCPAVVQHTILDAIDGWSLPQTHFAGEQ